MSITPALIKELNQKTGAGLMDCKKALSETDDDIQEAVQVIRKMGLATADKKSGRATNEGHVAAVVTDSVAVIAEILCETDFVSNTDNFKDFVSGLVERAAGGDFPEGDISEQILEAEQDNIGDLIASVDENIQIRRVIRWNPKGKAFSYIHDGGGVKFGVLVDIEGDADEDFGKNMAMHIAAANPEYVSPDDVPEKDIEREKEVAMASPDLEGKPDEIKEKIVQGKLNKWLSEVCLTKQKWAHDEKKVVEKVNPNATVVRFVRWQVGEEL